MRLREELEAAGREGRGPFGGAAAADGDSVWNFGPEDAEIRGAWDGGSVGGTPARTQLEWSGAPWTPTAYHGQTYGRTKSGSVFTVYMSGMPKDSRKNPVDQGTVARMAEEVVGKDRICAIEGVYDRNDEDAGIYKVQFWSKAGAVTFGRAMHRKLVRGKHGEPRVLLCEASREDVRAREAMESARTGGYAREYQQRVNGTSESRVAAGAPGNAELKMRYDGVVIWWERHEATDAEFKNMGYDDQGQYRQLRRNEDYLASTEGAEGR